MITNLIAGLLGLIFMVLAKMQSTRKDFHVAGQPFSAKKYFEDEVIGIGMSLVVIVLMALSIKEWVTLSPKAADYVTIIFALGGALGSWAFLLFLGNSKKYIRKIVDIKTNVSDQVIGKTTTVEEVIEKAADQGINVSPTPKA